tara:strand:- start:216 stop:323 length:108 start_codon:yes stop_codon:yes gene_type:complete
LDGADVARWRNAAASLQEVTDDTSATVLQTTFTLT